MTLVARVRLGPGDGGYSGSNMVVLLLSGLPPSALCAPTAGPLRVHLSAPCCRTFDSDSPTAPQSRSQSRDVATSGKLFQNKATRGAEGVFKLLIFGVGVWKITERKLTRQAVFFGNIEHVVVFNFEFDPVNLYV